MQDVRDGKFLRTGFTLVELLVLIGIAVLLLSIFIPYIADLRESNSRVRCTENLRQIHTALASYAAANVTGGGAELPLPRVRYEPSQVGDAWNAYTNPAANDPFAMVGGVSPNDVTASMWLLVRGKYISADRFICPSTSQYPDPMSEDGKTVPPDQRGNFSGPDHLSYSMASPFSSAEGYRWSTDWLKGDFAVMADKNPGMRVKGSNVVGPSYDLTDFETAPANSRNHGRAGQNVLYADGHIEFQKTPYCGHGTADRRDNIYTALTERPLDPKVEKEKEALGQQTPVELNGVWSEKVGPAWVGDSFLVPAEN